MFFIVQTETLRKVEHRSFACSHFIIFSVGEMSAFLERKPWMEDYYPDMRGKSFGHSTKENLFDIRAIPKENMMGYSSDQLIDLFFQNRYFRSDPDYEDELKMHLRPIITDEQKNYLGRNLVKSWTEFVYKMSSAPEDWLKKTFADRRHREYHTNVCAAIIAVHKASTRLFDACMVDKEYKCIMCLQETPKTSRLVIDQKAAEEKYQTDAMKREIAKLKQFLESLDKVFDRRKNNQKAPKRQKKKNRPELLPYPPREMPSDISWITAELEHGTESEGECKVNDKASYCKKRRVSEPELEVPSSPMPPPAPPSTPVPSSSSDPAVPSTDPMSAIALSLQSIQTQFIKTKEYDDRIAKLESRIKDAEHVGHSGIMQKHRQNLRVASNLEQLITGEENNQEQIERIKARCDHLSKTVAGICKFLDAKFPATDAE